jgi:DNA-binding transcriptional LysR family regulator
LGVTQPSVSETIANLEHAVGVRLLNRSPQGVELTIYGQSLLKGGVAAFDDLRQSIKEIEFLADPTIGDVRVGCPETVAILLPPIIQRLSLKHPRLVLHVSDVVAPTLDLPQLRDRSLDLALVRFGGSPSQHPFGDDLDVEVLFDDEVLVVVGKKSRWARDRRIDFPKLANEPWILPPLHTSNSRVVFEAFRMRGLAPPKVTIATFSAQLRTSMVAAGPYVTVLPRSMLHLHADRLSLKALPIKLPAHEFPVALATLKNRMPNPVVQLFIKHVRAGVRSMGLPRPARR